MKELEEFARKQRQRLEDAARELAEREEIINLPFTQQKTVNQLARRFFSNFDGYPGDDNVAMCCAVELDKDIMLAMFVNLDEGQFDLGSDLAGRVFSLAGKARVVSEYPLERGDCAVYLHGKNSRGEIVHAKAKLTLAVYRVKTLENQREAQDFSKLFSMKGELRKEGKGNDDRPFPFATLTPDWSKTEKGCSKCRELGTDEWTSETRENLVKALAEFMQGRGV